MMLRPVRAGVSAPGFMSKAVDALSVGSREAALMAILCYGAADVIKNVSKELLSPTFMPVTQVEGRAGAQARRRGERGWDGGGGAACMPCPSHRSGAHGKPCTQGARV